MQACVNASVDSHVFLQFSYLTTGKYVGNCEPVSCSDLSLNHQKRWFTPICTRKKSNDTNIVWNSNNNNNNTFLVLALVEAGLAPHMTDQTDFMGKCLLWYAAGSRLDVLFQFPARTPRLNPGQQGLVPL